MKKKKKKKKKDGLLSDKKEKQATKKKRKGKQGKEREGKEGRGELVWMELCCVWDGREVELIAWDGVMAWGGIGRVPLYSSPLQDCYISKQLFWA